MSLRTLALAAALAVAPVAAQAQLTENFNGGVPAGWTFWGGTGVSGGSAYAVGSTSFFSPTFVVGLGGQISFDARFEAGDYLPYNDYGLVRLYNVGTSSWEPNLFFRDIGMVGNYGNSGWVNVSSSVAPGTYQLQGRVQNVGDEGYPSTLRVDNLAVTSTAAPEPGTWALMITGLAGVAGVARRRRRA